MKTPKKQPEPYDDDDCEVCKLMRRGDVSREELEKVMSLQNFLNNFPKDKNKEE
ncbi:MAG: hypothetical protein UR23_C0021G0001 [Candidatus Roizmanbacteria bacterium GW2011_GWA2_32_13]|uniref:Uncharacterized protein n=1 Tax=Candidatus Roizmanbacteria bacterium GW2011_GWA2_32_13 TaxID=1618475 RepID=A0A0F9YXW7_9BACT|nr:MAG: hypothetical protein UR23_C0021G0001 [Candidatus Roizmanbacteria bacterium GW2011_GWA2_32_13]